MASLSDLKKAVRNTISRNSQAFIQTEALDTDGTSYSIDDVDASNDTFDVYDEDLSGDPDFAVGENFYLKDSTGNDRIYTVASVSTGDYDAEGDSTDSRISVEEDITDSTADGTIYVNKDHTWVNFGRFINASWETTPITSSADQDGRESTELFELTVSFSLIQTSNEEMSMMEMLAMPDPDVYEFYLNGHTLFFTSTHNITTTQLNAATDNATGEITFGTGTDELDDPDSFIFENVLLKPSPEIDFAGEESMIGLEFTGKVELQELTDIETTHKITISYE